MSTDINKFNSKPILEEAGPFANDINWGDSLVGRLINSFIRKSKIGYNQTKVEPLLEEFKLQIDSLLSNSIKKEDKDKFIDLMIRSYLTNIEDVVKGTLTFEQKLDQLIGGHRDLWDPQLPTGQQTGNWASVLSDSMLTNFHSYIYNEVDKDVMNKSGWKKDDVLNHISVFIDNCRKLTVQGVAPSNHANIPFVGNFNNLVQNLANVNAGLKISYYSEFINEELINGKDFASVPWGGEVLEIGKKYKGNGKEIILLSLSNIIKKGNNGEFLTDKDIKGEEIPENQAWIIDKDNKTYSISIVKILTKGNKAVKMPSKQQPTGDTKTSEGNLKKIKELSVELSDKKFKSDQDILGDEKCKELLNLLTKLNDDEKTKVGKETAELIKVVLDEAEEIKSGKKSEETSKETSKETEKEKIEVQSESLVIQFNRFRLFEEIQVNPAGNPPADRSDELDQVFGAFIDSFKGYRPITQNEADDLIKSIQGIDDQDLQIDLSKNADPIIAICRIFRRAHELYFTPIIPSGRSGSKVSNSVLREYQWVGSASPSLSENNAYGAWVNKKIFNKWRDGVLQILEDQKYRKILANVKFVVPGSEDEFNESTQDIIIKWSDFKKIFEYQSKDTDDEDDKTKKSHGQILFDFINDMIDTKGLSDFENTQRVLLKKYFGVKGLDTKKVIKELGRLEPEPAKPTKDNIDANTLKWNQVSSIKVDNQSQTYDTGGFYAIPIKDVNGTKVIFAHVLGKYDITKGNTTKVCTIIKFTFDKHKIATIFQNTQKSNYTLEDWNMNNQPLDGVYYGLMTSISSNKFNLTYANVGGGSNEIKEVYYHKFELDNGTKKDGKTLFLSRLIEYDSNKNQKEINVKLNKAVKSEDGDNNKNIQTTTFKNKKTNEDETMIVHLSEELKKHI